MHSDAYNIRDISSFQSLILLDDVEGNRNVHSERSERVGGFNEVLLEKSFFRENLLPGNLGTAMSA